MTKTITANMNYIIMPPTVGKEAISIAFVRASSIRLSVRPSYTERIIRECKGLACPNLEGSFPTLDATCIPVSRSNGQRSELEAGGGIPCWPNPAVTLLVKCQKLCKLHCNYICLTSWQYRPMSI